MFQYAIAKAISIKNLDNFKLDVSFYPKQDLRKYELHHFNIEEFIASKSEINKFCGNINILFQIKRKLGFKTKRPASYYSEAKTSVFDQNVFHYVNDIYLDGYWQNEEYFKAIRGTLINEFTLKKSMSFDAKNYISNIYNSQSVSLHVRRSDYVSNIHTNKVHGICKINYYKKAINYVSKNISNPVFYIFSDDLCWCKENFNFLRNKVFVFDTKSAVEDFELLKSCKHNIIANSSFSWWAGWLNTNTDKIVICPRNWFNDRHTISPACGQWVKI